MDVFLLGIYLGVELLVHMLTHVYLFEELPVLQTSYIRHFTFPPAMYEGSSFATSSLIL